MPRCWLWIGLTVSFFLIPVPHRPQTALAQTSDQASEDLARARFLEGRAAYDARDYMRAFEQFQASYSMSRQPKLLYNLGVTAQKLGKLSESVQYFENYLAWGEGDRSEEVRGRLAALRDMLAQPAPSSDGAPAPQLDAAPPTHISSTATAQAAAAEPAPKPAPSATETAASTAHVEPALVPAAAAHAKDVVPTVRPYWRRAWFWTVVGVVVAGAVTTAVVLSVDRGPEQTQAHEHIMTLGAR